MSMLTLLDMSASYPLVLRPKPGPGLNLLWSTMTPVGRHSGERTEAAATSTSPGPSYVAPKAPRRTILLLALGVTVTLVAWGVLVHAAIDFGGEARSGESTAWVFLVLATMGAAAFLFVTLLLGARILSLVQGHEPPPPRPLGGRRASR